jgi:hypothetical protein
MSDDYLAYDRLVEGYGEDTARRLVQMGGLTGHHGEPCVERDRLDDLLGLLRIEAEGGAL